MNKKIEEKTNKVETKKVVTTGKESNFKKKKRVKRNITSGIAYVYSTFNNTILSVLFIGFDIWPFFRFSIALKKIDDKAS